MRAAVCTRNGPPEVVELDPDTDDEASMVAVDCTAVLDQAWRFGRRFVGRGRGGIVPMSSLPGSYGTPRAADHAATTAYVQSPAEGLRAALGLAGVDVIASAPGPVASGFAARAGMRMARAQDPAPVARGTLDALGHRGTVRPGAVEAARRDAGNRAPAAAGADHGRHHGSDDRTSRRRPGSRRRRGRPGRARPARDVGDDAARDRSRRALSPRTLRPS
ncbi:MAG: SDR family NAD(P)-dependent oxidoreductase [Burkholderiaceae bacterium]|jgi:hypothetical protein|nr:SDR family NAD(P)-dependent oxidoreductase [Burkholderiales bacterium]MCZ8337532.1 SDR family NAD(P)-dependent oxidoreductase [Burkholderiaceae bacterium]